MSYVSSSEINTALDGLNISIPSGDAAELLVQGYASRPNNVEFKFSEKVDKEGKLQFVSEYRIEKLFTLLQDPNQESQPHLSVELPLLKESFPTINFLSIHSTEALHHIKINEPFGRVLDADFIHFIDYLKSLEDELFVVEFEPSIPRMLEIPSKSELYKSLHGYETLEFPDYFPLNRRAQRLLSEMEFSKLQNVIQKKLSLLNISEESIRYIGQSLTVSIPKGSAVSKWFERYAPKKFPFSHMELTVAYIDQPESERKTLDPVKVLEFAIGRKVKALDIQNYFSTELSGAMVEIPSDILKEVQQMYLRTFDEIIIISNLGKLFQRQNNSENPILSGIPPVFRSALGESITSKGILVSEPTSYGWTNEQIENFSTSLDLTSWRSLPHVSDLSPLIATDPEGTAKPEVAFSVTESDQGGYEIGGYVLASNLMIPVYSEADQILAETGKYLPECGLYPSPIARQLCLSCIEDRPMLYVKMLLTEDYQTEIMGVSLVQGKIDHKISYMDAQCDDKPWSAHTILHRSVSALLKQSPLALKRIPINEDDFSPDTYEFHMLLNALIGKWCSQNNVIVPYRVTEIPTQVSDLIPTGLRSSRLNNLQYKNPTTLRHHLIADQDTLDDDTRRLLFRSFRAKGRFSIDPFKEHWFLGLTSYAPIGGSLRRDTSRISLHQITEFLNNNSGLSRSEINARLVFFNREQNEDYSKAPSKIRELRDKSLEIGRRRNVTIESIISRTQTVLFIGSDKIKYEVFCNHNLTSGMTIPLLVTGYDINNKHYIASLKPNHID